MGESLVHRIGRIAVAPTGIRSRLLLAFMLMSAVPLVMLFLLAGWFAFPAVREFWHLDRWFPMIANPTEATWWLIGIITLTVVVALLGSIYLTIKLVEPVIQLSHEAKHMAEGEFDGELPMPESNDELSDLTTSLNRMTSRIRDNMVELKQFGERTKQINFEIHKRMVMLSGLFQIGELISSGTDLDVVLDLVVEKLALLDNGCFSFLSLQPIPDLSLTLRRAHHLDVKQLNSLVFQSSQALIDSQNLPRDDMREAWVQLGQPNLLLQPVVVRGRPVGVLAVGNAQEGYTWSSEWVDLVGVFVKQTSIAIENELLLRKAKALAIRDELTGVYNEPYIHQRLAEELKRAVMYQRPCAFAVFALHGLEEFRRRRGQPESERALKKAARLVQDSVTEIDRVGRFNSNELVVLLPERNKRQALELIEEIRKRVTFAFAEAPDPQDRLFLLGGLAENPLDGVTAEDLIEKATTMMRNSGVAEPQVAATHV